MYEENFNPIQQKSFFLQPCIVQFLYYSNHNTSYFSFAKSIFAIKAQYLNHTVGRLDFKINQIIQTIISITIPK